VIEQPCQISRKNFVEKLSRKGKKLLSFLPFLAGKAKVIKLPYQIRKVQSRTHFGEKLSRKGQKLLSFLPFRVSFCLF